jgi:hypothetical protein
VSEFIDGFRRLLSPLQKCGVNSDALVRGISVAWQALPHTGDYVRSSARSIVVSRKRKNIKFVTAAAARAVFVLLRGMIYGKKEVPLKPEI